MYLFVQKRIFLKKVELLKSYKKIMIEEFIGGREIQVAILGKKN